jgi:anti-anti-sigma factor
VCGEKGHEVAFRGEFDISCYATLGSALEDALRRETKIFVDLSGVTFMDASCVRELALLRSLYGERLVLETPSREVGVAVAVCGMEDLLWIGISRRETRACPRRGAKSGGREAGFSMIRKTGRVRRALR